MKIVKQIKFEGVWGKLVARTCFKKQSFTRYLRDTWDTLKFLCKIAHCGKGSISVLQEIFGSRSWILSHLVTRETTRIYQFITNNQFLFHLWWKKNLLNHQKVLKCYEHDCSISEPENCSKRESLSRNSLRKAVKSYLRSTF